jgi:Carboxypeptidase regulatory-like domain/TonB dependent receptor
MDNWASGLFVLVRGCKDSSGLRKSGFGHRLSPLLVALVLMFVIPCSASAQATATLNGVVRDSSGAVIPQATVTLRNTDTSTERQSLTNDSGLYVFVSVPPGEYALKVTKDGFTTATQGLHVVVNQASTQDFTLRVGSTQQSVTVEASAVNLETGNATLGSVIESNQVRDLPLNGRNFTQLLALTPGVSPVSVAQNHTGAQAAPVGSFVFPAVNGQSNRSNFFMLDGIDNTDQVFTTYAIAPILDDIQEFKVQSHSDEIQFGGVLGGIVNVVTKSGTNNFHGTAWEFFRNTVLDAKDPLKGVASKLEQNQFGANFGGPVILPFYNGRNKTFFFGSYEGFRRAQPSTGAFYNVPTPAELSGDFSALCGSGFDSAGVCLDRDPQGNVIHQLYNPFTTSNNTRNPFPNNDISGVLNPGAVSLAQAIFPAPKPVINGFNGYDLRSVLTPQNQYSFRVDENFNASNSLFFRYSKVDQPMVGTGGIVGLDQTTDTFGKQYVLSYYHQFNPSTILDAKFGHVELTHNQDAFFSALEDSSVITAAGISDTLACGFSGGHSCLIPSLDIPAYLPPGGAGPGTSDTKLTDIYQWTANLTKIFRKHTLTAGFDLETDSLNVGHTSDQVVFAVDQTANPQQVAGTGDAMASFFIGTASNGSRRDTVAPVLGQRAYGGYFMDKWKVTDRLTLNLGLRYDLALLPTYGKASDGTNAIGNIDFNNGTYVLQTSAPDCATKGIAPCIPGGLPQANVVVSKNGHLFSNTHDNVQPRIGLAYALNDKTVVRASFGMFNDLWAGITQTVQGIGGDWPSLGQIMSPALNTFNEVATVNWQNPLSALGTDIPAPTPFGQTQWYRDPKAKNPYSEQWNFGVQRQLGSSTVMTANYVGSQSHRLTVGGLYNVALTPGPGTPAEVAARQPYPYISPTFYDRSVGNSSYNAFQFSMNHQASSGLAYLVSYTWSKSIDVGCSGFFGIESCSVQNPYNLKGDRSVSGFDLPHNLTASAVAPLPFGRGKRFANSSSLVNYIVGNWQLNGILTLTSGVPYDVYISSDIPNVGNFAPAVLGNGSVRANLVGDPHLSSPSTQEWFNTAAFVQPPQFTFGTSGRNSLRADWFKNLDLSLFRDFPFGERRSFQFRAEAFNVTNTPTWGIPVNDLNLHAQFGSITSTRSTQRQLQLSLKLYF